MFEFIDKPTGAFYGSDSTFFLFMDWKEEIENYTEYLKLQRGLSNNSVKAYINDLDKLEAYLVSIDRNIGPDEVTLSDLRGLTEYLTTKNVGVRSQVRIISGIKSFFRYLMIEERIEKDPTEQLKVPKIARKLPEVLSVGEIEQLLNSIDVKSSDGLRNKAIISTLYSSGVRVSELVNLKISNLAFNVGYMKVEGKGSKERIVPINKQTMQEVSQYIETKRKEVDIKPEAEDYVFVNKLGTQLSRIMIFNIIKKAARDAGITKNISPHTLRHSFATHLVNGGANLRSVQEMLGHESIVTTEIYTHVNAQYLKETIEKHPGIKDKNK